MASVAQYGAAYVHAIAFSTLKCSSVQPKTNPAHNVLRRANYITALASVNVRASRLFPALEKAIFKT